MNFLKSNTNNPYFNIATEDYLLHQFKEDFFFLYIDQPSVICGKHQNALAEINYPFIQNHQIDVVRRLSGGGAVYHDLGNVNFCFIMNVEDGKMVDFKKHTTPLMRVIESFGANPVLGVRNDILIDGLKVSGNAEHVWKNRVLHHGTLLFNSDLDQLNEAIKVDEFLFVDKAVRSKRSHVANINSSIGINVTQQQFVQRIEEIVSDAFNVEIMELSDFDILSIQNLVESKYKTWEWNFGYSPKYNFKKEITIGDAKYFIDIFVEKGVIVNAHFFCNNVEDVKLSLQLIGSFHRIESLEKVTLLPIDFLEKLFF